MHSGANFNVHSLTYCKHKKKVKIITFQNYFFFNWLFFLYKGFVITCNWSMRVVSFIKGTICLSKVKHPMMPPSKLSVNFFLLRLISSLMKGKYCNKIICSPYNSLISPKILRVVSTFSSPRTFHFKTDNFQRFDSSDSLNLWGSKLSFPVKQRESTRKRLRIRKREVRTGPSRWASHIMESPATSDA